METIRSTVEYKMTISVFFLNQLGLKGLILDAATQNITGAEIIEYGSCSGLSSK